jgi:hypothetical protein
VPINELKRVFERPALSLVLSPKVDASGERRSQPPYTRFFGKVTPSAAQELGIEREIELATSWLVELAHDPSEALSRTWTPKLKAATDNHTVDGFARREVNRGLWFSG